MANEEVLILESPWSEDIEDTQATRDIYASAEAQRNSSQRASAATARARSRSARACSRSYSERQSRGVHTGAASGDDQIPSSLSTSVRPAPKSSSRTAMPSTIARGVPCLPAPCRHSSRPGGCCRRTFRRVQRSSMSGSQRPGRSSTSSNVYPRAFAGHDTNPPHREGSIRALKEGRGGMPAGSDEVAVLIS